MADPEPAPEAMTGLDPAPTSWARARGLLEKTRPTYWLATVRPRRKATRDALLGVWVEGETASNRGRPSGRVLWRAEARARQRAVDGTPSSYLRPNGRPAQPLEPGAPDAGSFSAALD
jgi:hypothetical protein